MLFHICGFAAGFFLDLLIGDPHWFYHPVRLIGKAVDFFTERFLGENRVRENGDVTAAKDRRTYGMITVCIVCFLAVAVTGFILLLAYSLNRWLGLIVEAFLTYTILAAKSLRCESMAVYKKLKTATIEESRKQLSMIVGRDTQCLDEEHIIMATVETVAENTSDGVIAPMIFTAIGGPVLGYFYKAVNTMDSMIGYKNDKFIDFGRTAAKFDDVVNYIPARISGYLMIASAGICSLFSKKYSMAGACRIFKRDRYNHSSPNSAQTESACAGALGLRLAGDASYFGKIVSKPFIGDAVRPIEHNDIKRVNILMYLSAFLCFVICVAVMLGIMILTK